MKYFKKWFLVSCICLALSASPASAAVVQLPQYFGEWNDVYQTAFNLKDGERYSDAWGHSGFPGSTPPELLLRLGTDISSYDRFNRYHDRAVNYYSFLVVGSEVIHFVSLDAPGPVQAVPEIPTWLMMLVGFGALGWMSRRTLVR